MFSFKSTLPLLAILLVGLELASASAAATAKSETKFTLKCFQGLDDCSLIESDVDHTAEDEGAMIKKRSIEDGSDYHSKVQKVVKKFMATGGEAHKVFKTDEINCLTGDCRVLTAKINKRARNFGSSSLACVGNPYSNSGSSCVPLEGLYIG